MRTIRHHLMVYAQLLSYSVKYVMAYRLNMAIQIGYTFVYYGMLFTVINVVFHQTPTLGGWSRPEAILIFLVYLLLYNLADALYLRGAYLFMESGVDRGDFDRALTKPISPHLLVLFGTPMTHLMVVAGLSLVLLIRHLSQFELEMPNIAVSVIVSIICFSIAFFIMSIYTTLAFHVTRSVQVFHTFEKVSDFAQYPTHIFPKVIEFTFYTFLPVALYGYVPTLFLLGRGSWTLFLSLIGLLGITFIVQKIAWKVGIKRYSSASS